MEISPFLMPLVTLAVSFIIASVINLILRILAGKAEKTSTKIDDIILNAIRRPLYMLIIVAGIYYAIHQTPYLGDWINKFDEGYKYRHFILAIFGTWVVATLAKRFIREYGYELTARTDGHVDERIVAFADMTATYVIWMLGILIALAAVGVEITPLITGMGIAGFAIALAAQNLLSNVFGGVTITLDQLYKVGDRVEMGNVYGDIYEIKPRYTKIRTLNNTIITIPNSKVINEQLINYGLPDTTARVKIPISVAYGTDPKKVDEILLDIVSKIPLALQYPKPFVRFTEYASSSQNFELLVWIKHYDERHPVIDLIFREMFNRFRKEGIEIPFKQMDVHLKK